VIPRETQALLDHQTLREYERVAVLRREADGLAEVTHAAGRIGADVTGRAVVLLREWQEKEPGEYSVGKPEIRRAA
jgi:hypothetical protein